MYEDGFTSLQLIVSTTRVYVNARCENAENATHATAL